MSKNARVALAVAGIAILVVAAVLIGTKGDGTDNAQPAPTAETGMTAATAEAGHAGRGASGATTGGEGSGGASPGHSGHENGNGGAGVQQQSGGGQPTVDIVSPVLEIDQTAIVTAKKGQVVTIRGRSDEAAELHVHGYDKVVELKPGKVGRITFKTNIDGEFEIELHTASSATQVGTLRVNP